MPDRTNLDVARVAARAEDLPVTYRAAADVRLVVLGEGVDPDQHVRPGACVAPVPAPQGLVEAVDCPVLLTRVAASVKGHQAE